MAIDCHNCNHLLIGLGGTGGKILKAFKKKFYEEYTDEELHQKMHAAITFLYVDSTDEMMKNSYQDPSWMVKGRNVAFSYNEFLNIQSQSGELSAILDHVDYFPGLQYVVQDANIMRYALGFITVGAGQNRRAGRILFASHINDFLSVVTSKYSDMMSVTHSESLHVHIFTGLAGGTGSGSVVDAIAQIRKRYPKAIIDVYAEIPGLKTPGGYDRGRYHANVYAALRELSAMNLNQFLPSDVQTGEEHIELMHPWSGKQFTLRVFSHTDDEENEVRSKEELYQMVVESIFYLMFLPCTEKNYKLLDFWNFDFPTQDMLVDFDKRPENVYGKLDQTKAVCTFDLKRMVYPEKRVLQHISYTVAERSIRKLLYHNFDEKSKEYVNVPLEKDYAEIVRNDELLHNWMLDDRHLTLDEVIKPLDWNYGSFISFWRSNVYRCDYEYAKANGGREPLRYLENFCQELYDHEFRRTGVEQYFANESSNIASFSHEIVEGIQRNLCLKWRDGDYSLVDLLGVCEKILKYIKEKYHGLEDEISTIDKHIEEQDKDRLAIIDEYANAGIIGRAFKGSGFYLKLLNLLQELYCNKTLRVAKDFEEKLLARLCVDLEYILQDLQWLFDSLKNSQKFLNQFLDDSFCYGNDVYLHKAVIEMYDYHRIVSFENRITHDRATMDNLASVVREQLFPGIGTAFFRDYLDRLDDNAIANVAEQYLSPQIRAYYENDSESHKDEVFGINFLCRLHQSLNMSELNIGDFACLLVQRYDMLLKLSPSYTNAVRNALIVMPQVEYGDEETKAFAERLKSALREAFERSEHGPCLVYFDESSSLKNEISVFQFRNLFPMRALKCLPKFKAKYNALVNSYDEEVRTKSRISLHVEGDGQDLPSLEKEGDGGG